MKLYLWIAGLVLLAVAGLAVWWNFSDPKFVAGLASIAFAAIMPLILKRKSVKNEQAWRDATLEGKEWDHNKNKPKDPK